MTVCVYTAASLLPPSTSSPARSAQNKICYDIFVLSGVVDHFQLNITALGNLLTVVRRSSLVVGEPAPR